jgi:hypothetical protein
VKGVYKPKESTGSRYPEEFEVEAVLLALSWPEKKKYGKVAA